MQNITEERRKLLVEFQGRISYSFKDINILNRALTHSSYANEIKNKRMKNNERLEFLGDAVLSVTVSDYIFNKYPDYPEGELTKLRATVVCEPVLASLSRKLNVGKYLLLGKGEEATGGRERESILADAFEAIIASIYIDGGLENAKQFILSNISLYIKEAVMGKLFLDYKTQLQETLQKSNKGKIQYNVVKEKGPDHNKTFYIEVSVDNKVLGDGMGKSKKEAEQNAAKKALNRIGVIDE